MKKICTLFAVWAFALLNTLDSSAWAEQTAAYTVQPGLALRWHNPHPGGTAVTGVDGDGVADDDLPAHPVPQIGACAGIHQTAPYGQAQALISHVASEVTCQNDRRATDPTAFARFCTCIRDTTASGYNSALYPRIGATAFASIEQRAMQAAIAMRMNSLRGPLRKITRALTYAAFNPNLRSMVAPIRSNGAIVQPAATAGLSCLPGNMGKYVDLLKTRPDSKCNNQALGRLDRGMMSIWRPEGTGGVTPNASDTNFGYFLDRAYTKVFTQGFGVSSEVTPDFIQNPDVTNGLTMTDDGMAGEGDEDTPEPSANAVANVTVTQRSETNDGALSAVLYTALRKIAAGQTATIAPSNYPKLKLNGLVAGLVTDDNDVVSPEKVTAFLNKLMDSVKNPDGTLPRRGAAFSGKLTEFLRAEVRTNLQDCENTILKQVEEKICPLISEDKFSITSLLGVLDTPEKRKGFSDIMRAVAHNDSAAAETDQMLCFTYGNHDAMKSIFSYTSGVPITEDSVVFHFDPNETPDDVDLHTPDHENAADGALIANQRSQGKAIRMGQMVGMVFDAGQVDEISNQYRRGGNSANNALNKISKNDSPAKKSNDSNASDTTNNDSSNNGGNNKVNNSNVTPKIGGGNFGGGSNLLPNLGGGLGSGNDGGNSSGSGSSQGGQAGNGTVDYAARIAELQKMIDDREKKLRDAMAAQNGQVSDSLVSAARDRDTEIRGLKDELKRLREDLATSRSQAVASGVALPAPVVTPTPAPTSATTGFAAAPISGGTTGKPGVPFAAAPLAGPLGGSAGQGPLLQGDASSGSDLHGYDLSSSLGFVSNLAGRTLTYNGSNFTPSFGQLVIPRVEFDGADTTKRQQMYALANGAPIYVVNDDDTVTVYVAHNDEDGQLAYAPDGVNVPNVAKTTKAKKKGRAIASEGAPVVVATPAPEAARVRHQDLLNLMNGGGTPAPGK